MTTQLRLKQLFNYNPDTGLFTRLVDIRRVKPRDIARYTDRLYVRIRIDHKLHQASHLAWLYTHGEFPKGQIKYINGIRNDNRIVNLRDVPRTESNRNRKLPKDNTSGTIGVYWDEECGKWWAKISVDGKQTRLGYFTLKSDAITARKDAEVEHGYHENHGRVSFF